MSRPISVRNPRSGQMDFTIQAPSSDQLKKQAYQLRQAQSEWAKRTAEQRAQHLLEWLSRLTTDHHELLNVLMEDTGRRSVAHQEMQAFFATIQRWASEGTKVKPPAPRPSEYFATINLESRYDPYPLVGVISPWNFPLLLSFIDTLPALMAGCAAMVKPSEVTPRFVAPLQKSIDLDPVLSSVLKLVPGDGETGAAVVDLVDAIAFTGSVKTGRKVGETAAARFIPAFLELGGKDPAIVLPDADIEKATTALLRGSIVATGQACQSIERIYVHDRIFERFTDRLVEKANTVTFSYPDPNQGIIGPLIFAKQAEIIQKHLYDAEDKGAKILCGGRIEQLDGGYYIAPTVLTNVTHKMDVIREETFGPVLPVMSFSNEDEAITLANDTIYGLSACVFSENIGHARKIADRLNAGGVSINDAALTSMVHEIEKSGYGLSGIGPSRMGTTGMTRFFRHKAYYIQTGAPAPIEAFAEVNGPVQSSAADHAAKISEPVAGQQSSKGSFSNTFRKLFIRKG